MNTEQDRADFEAWYMREFEVYPRRNESGGFKSQYVNAMFKSWKAGRAALQSPDIQERIRDGERLEWLAENINEIEVYRSQRGWCVVEKGITHSIVEVYKTLRGALDAAMEKQP